MDIRLFGKEFCDYSKHIRGYSPYTIKRYSQVINSFAGLEKIEELEEVSLEKLRDFFLNGRTKENWKSASYISYRNTLCVFFD